MARIKSKWKLLALCYLLIVNVYVKCLPVKSIIDKAEIITSDTIFKNAEVPQVNELLQENNVHSTVESVINDPSVSDGNITEVFNITRSSIETRNLVPGQEVRQYAVQITLGENDFQGRLVADVVVSADNREEPIRFLAEDLNIQSVLVGVFAESNAVAADWEFGELDDGRNTIDIQPNIPASSFIVIIEYSGQLTNTGRGLYKGVFGEHDYVGMNLHPTHARRVFPCMDDAVEASTISFTFENVDYNNLYTNSILEDNSVTEFRALQGPPQHWSMMAHSFNNIGSTLNNVVVFARPGVVSQDAMALIAVNNFFTQLNEWTNKPFFEIVLNQNPQLIFLAMPDVSRDWRGLSTIGIWEPHFLMENTCSAKQKYLALSTIARSLANQWFGYVVYPENYRYEWVVSGLANFAAYEILKEFQTTNINALNEWLDIKTLFVTEVIQESLLWDSYSGVGRMEPENDLTNEDEIRDNLIGLQLHKSPAIMNMLNIIFGEGSPGIIEQIAKTLLAGRSLQTINSLDFIDAFNSHIMFLNNNPIGELEEFLAPYTQSTGYPLLSVSWTQSGATVSLERFSFTTQQGPIDFSIPLTYSISNNPNFEDAQVYPVEMVSGAYQVPASLDDEDYILFNIQGQGYYRVHYDGLMWERILEALEDPDRRAEIHPLNRATLLDDVMVLARGGRVGYDTALRVVLSWEHETEYAPWKAFVRNMDFLRKRLTVMVTEDEDLDPDIYLRMVRRTIGTFEQEIGFYPDPSVLEPAMTSLTRGLVMDHACRANYEPCIAAALDWFYDPNANEPTVNPDIPRDIRPAVYCTMVKISDDGVAIQALQERLEIEPSMYERVVILESLGCSEDPAYINQLLLETISANSPYTPEERFRIFRSIVESSFGNADAAFQFLVPSRGAQVRAMYGGAEKLDEVVKVIALNMMTRQQMDNLMFFFTSGINELGDSEFIANRHYQYALEDFQWQEIYLESIYEWIDENDAPTLMVSFVLIIASFFIALFNH